MADPSDNVCIETLRPNSVPDGLVALGIVVQVSDLQVKLQLTGGIICIVDRDNVSQAYSNILRHYTEVHGQCEEPPSLTKLFKRGQQFICKVVEKRPRKGYAEAQDIIATLDPGEIQEDVVPKALLAIPFVPLQAAVLSIEDHGYQMDIGFKNLTGFLTFDEAEEYCSKHNDSLKLSKGQVVRCVLKNSLHSDSESRIVQLTMSKEALKKSEFSREKVSQNALTHRYILPGSKSFLTVMKVQNEGLIVNFMNEFAGFVSNNHLKDQWHSPRENYKISDQFKCTVLYYNHITKSFALSLKTKSNYKKTLKLLLENYHVGQILKSAKVACLIGAKSVKFRIDNNFKGIANVRDALDDDLSTMTKDEILTRLDSTFPDNSAHKCRIKSINLADLILVVSLRQDFLDLPYVSVEELKPTNFIEVDVKKYVKDGIIVTFGLNLKAIILNVHLHDYVSSSSYKRYPIGKKIVCRVMKVDMLKQPPRVYLTNKEQLMDKKLEVITSYDKSLKGKSTHAIIIKVAKNGLIVEFFNNLKGFIPSRFLSSVPIKNTEDLFKIGQVISCVVYRCDPNRNSLLLGVVDYQKIVSTLKEKKQSKKNKKELKEMSKLDRKIERSNTSIKSNDSSATLKKSNRVNVLAAKKDENSSLEKEPSSRSEKRQIETFECDSDLEEGIIKINPEDFTRHLAEKSPDRPVKRFKFLDTSSGINWSAGEATKIGADNELNVSIEASDQSEDDDDSSSTSSNLKSDEEQDNSAPLIKSRRQRSEEAKLREEKLREAENNLLNPDRRPQSIPDFERLVLKTPNQADIWIKYSNYFLENVETEKARIVCRRALRTINFRLEKEKLKVWLHLIKIEAKYGGSEKMKEIVEEAAQTNDHISLYRGTSKVLTASHQLDDAEYYHELVLKTNGSRTPEVWLDYIQFMMEQRKDVEKARSLFKKASEFLQRSHHVILKSRFAQLEFKFGEVERGKTIFENLMSDNPKRTDLWKVYESMVKKYGSRQNDTFEAKEQNESILRRIADNIELVTKKKKTLPVKSNVETKIQV